MAFLFCLQFEIHLSWCVRENGFFIFVKYFACGFFLISIVDSEDYVHALTRATVRDVIHTDRIIRSGAFVLFCSAPKCQK